MNRSKNLPFRLILLLVVLVVGITVSSHDTEAAQMYCPVQWAVSCDHCEMICRNAHCDVIDCIGFPDGWYWCGCADAP